MAQIVVGVLVHFAGQELRVGNRSSHLTPGQIPADRHDRMFRMAQIVDDDLAVCPQRRHCCSADSGQQLKYGRQVDGSESNPSAGGRLLAVGLALETAHSLRWHELLRPTRIVQL